MPTDVTASADIQSESTEPRWHPLRAIERRVLGVLVEKAKTTPENYPLSLNAIRVGANQKSNRAPQMQLDDHQVDAALETLREAGAVVEIQGDGRVPKYRHLAYDWLGVDKVQLAVLAELLLRGDQTVGELRGRAARMEPIADLAALRPVLDALGAKGLIQYLTPQGRGCVVTHTLYQPEELAKVRAKYVPESGIRTGAPAGTGGSSLEQTSAAATSSSPPPAGRSESSQVAVSEELASLRTELTNLRDEMASLRSDVLELQEVLKDLV